jgi:DNA-binding Lrp family transcriptional regulator
MGKDRTSDSSREENNNLINLDRRDRQILDLLLSGSDNRDIASRLKIPMSTVQRRTRKLFADEIVKNRVELNYRKLGFRSGLLHVYLKNGNIDDVARQVSVIKGIQSTTIHIGNSDVVGLFVFKETPQLLDIMSETKKIEGVDRVVWSEEVVDVPNSGNKSKTILEMLGQNQ